MDKEGAVSLLDYLFNPNHISWRTRKIELLYDLASGVSEGCIVELGTDEGMGAFALAYGARDGVKVYTIDPFTSCWSSALTTGWGPDKEYIFYDNLKKLDLSCKITQIKRPSGEAVGDWEKPIGFLFWDTTVDGASIARDLQAWDRHILPGGRFMARDKDDGVFGSQEAIRAFTQDTRLYSVEGIEKFTIILKKRKPEDQDG